MRAGKSHKKRETKQKAASALKLVSRCNKKISSNTIKLVKAKSQWFRVEVEKNAR